MQPLEEVNVQKRMLLRREIQTAFEYSTCNNGECLPEICNEFVAIYMPTQSDNAQSIQQNIFIDLIRHMCSWMFEKGFTSSKIGMI